MNNDKKWFFEKLKNEYENNKSKLWGTLGGFIAFNYNYYEKINKIELPNDCTTVEDLMKNDISIKISVTLMIEELLKKFLNEISYRDELNNTLNNIRIDYEMAFRESKKEDLSKKNFAGFIWFLQDYSSEINSLTNIILEDVKSAHLKWIGLKYQKQGMGIYRNSPFRLAEINLLIAQARENKPEKSKAPVLTLISNED